MLTTPFINSLSAFDATKTNTSAYVSVLGGDIITLLTFNIYDNQSTSTTPLYTYTLDISDDIESEDIRNFSIVIPANTLTNNGIYYMTTQTENSDLSETSELALPVPFRCYVTPCLVVKYNDGTSFVPLTNNIVFNATSVPITLEFDTIDLNSTALLNSLEVTVFGVKSSGVFDTVYSSGVLYNSPFAQTITGLSNTTTSNAIYQFFKFVVNAETTDGMKFTQLNISDTSTPIYANQILNLGCSFVEYGAGGSFYAINDSENGKIGIHYNVPVVKNNPFSTNDIEALAKDNGYIYCGGDNGSFAVYDKLSGTFSNLIANPFGTSRIQALTVDDTSVYCTGNGGKFAIYDKASETFGNLITNPFGANEITGISNDSENVYCGGGGGLFAIYNKASGTFGSLIPNPFENLGYQFIFSITQDDEKVYCGGLNGGFAVYNKSSGTFGNLVTDPFGTSGIWFTISDNENVYCGAANCKFAIYNKSSGTFGSLITNPFGSSGAIYSIDFDTANVYCGGSNGKFAIYNKASGAFGGLKPTPFGAATINCIIDDDTGIYFGVDGGAFSIYNKIFDLFSDEGILLVNNPFGANGLLSMSSDNENVYCGGSDGKFAIYNKISKTFSSLITNAFSTNDINAITDDDTNVYCCGDGGSFAIYNKASETFAGLVTTPFSTTDIWSITDDDINVYCGGNNGTFAIYNKASETFGSLIATPFGSNRIGALTNDDTNVYCGAFDLFALYSKGDNVFGDLIAYPRVTAINTMVNDDTNVYCASNGGYFDIYNKSNNTFGSYIYTPFASSSIRAIVGDNENVYCGATNGKFAIYNKSSGTFGSLITNPFTSIYSLTSDDTSVYCGGYGVFAIYDKSVSKFISVLNLILERKADTETEWITLQDNLIFSSFILYDTYNQHNKVYTYRLRASTVTNASITCSVLSQFYKSYICDSTTLYDITNELQYDSEETVQSTITYQPIGGQYPFYGANAKTKYRAGKRIAILLAFTSTIKSYIDRMAQVTLKNTFNDWLTNHKGKILKDFNGDILVVAIQNSVSNNYYKELGNGFASTAFEYVEVGKLNNKYLSKLGMLNKFTVTYLEE